MAWLRTGTVAVTNGNTTVTGTGTGFAAGCRTGDAFIGPDGRNYEIVNVASATVISIFPAYAGPTASGAAYGIMPVQGYNKDSADQLRSLTVVAADKLGALGTTGNYDVLPLTKGGTGQAVNSSIELLGALGAMPGAGGSYTPRFSNLRLTAATAAGAGDGTYIGWNDTGGVSGASSFVNNKGGGEGGFSFRSVNANNTVGGPTTTLSYSGVLNVPAGIQLGGVDVIARGTNGNGTFTKFADGTLICEAVSPTASSASSANGACFVGASQTMSFAYAFIEPPVVVPTLTRSSATLGPAWAYLAAVDRSATQTTINIAATTQNATGYNGYIAKGRWK